MIFLTPYLNFTLYSIYSPEATLNADLVPSLVKDGWSIDPNLDYLVNLQNKHGDSQWIGWVFGFLSLNLIFYFSWLPTYADVGVQTDLFVEIAQRLTSISNTASILSVSNSPVDSLSTVLSSIPSIPNTEDLFPELIRQTEY